MSGPVHGGVRGYPWNKSLFKLKGRGYDYTENEYFYSGTATDLATGATAPYESRMLERLPRSAKRFKGTVGRSDLEGDLVEPVYERLGALDKDTLAGITAGLQARATAWISSIARRIISVSWIGNASSENSTAPA